MCGACFTMIVSLLMSIVYGFNDATTISPELITPLLREIIFKNHNKNDGKLEGKLSPATMKDTEFWYEFFPMFKVLKYL